jgi:SAM-dependent methyltransferase
MRALHFIFQAAISIGAVSYIWPARGQGDGKRLDCGTMTDPSERSIEAARRSFNEELLSADYPRIHGDDEQVNRLVDFLDPHPGGAYLDLATGNGVVAFAVAGRQPEARVIGVDIADQAISRNREAAREQGRANLEFSLSDGCTFDCPDAAFDGMTWRYALHHFPDLAATLTDARRVLKPGAPFAVADAVRHPADERDFINRFQALKPDGHVRIYTAEALLDLFRAQGFEADGRFASAISFTRDLNAAYRDLIDEMPPEILQLYDVRVDGDRAALTFDIFNVRFLAPAD